MNDQVSRSFLAVSGYAELHALNIPKTWVSLLHDHQNYYILASASIQLGTGQRHSVASRLKQNSSSGYLLHGAPMTGGCFR